jgi:membrane protein DedA with SNARE-associated domain
MASDPRFAKVVQWVKSRGTLLLLLSRFLWGLRAAIPAACGATGMKPVRFFLVNLAGAVLWSVPIALAGYAGARSIHALSRGLLKYEWQMAAALLFGGLLFVLWKTHGEELKESWMAVRDPDDLGVISVETLGHPPRVPRWRALMPPEA